MAKKALLKDGKVLCSLCSNPVDTDASTCEHCGELLEGDFNAMICPDCEIILANGTHKCYNCGLKFKVVSRKKAKNDDSQEQEREEFLGRLLSWTEDDGKREPAPVIRKPAVPAADAERAEPVHELEERTETEESAEGLADAFKAIISERKQRWDAARFESLDAFKKLRNEERKSLERLESLAGKMELVLKDNNGHNPGPNPDDDGDGELTIQRQLIEKLETELKEERARLDRILKERAELKGLHDEFKEVMKFIDELLGKLPEDEIERFAKSKDYEKYENILKKLSL